MEKKQTFSVHTERDVKLTVEDIDDIMVAALEGGINYQPDLVLRRERVMANKPVLGIIDCPHCGRANMV